MTKPIAKGTSHFPTCFRHFGIAAMDGRRTRRASQGSITSEYARRAMNTTMTTARSNSPRVFRTRLLRKSVTVWKPISGRKRPKASSAVTAASRSARIMSTRPECAALGMSDLFDIRPPKQPLRQEDQCNCQYRKGGNVLVVDREIGRPHGFDQPNEQAAVHGPRQ